MRFPVASLSLLVAHAFVAPPCAAQQSETGSSARPLDLSIRRSMLPAQSPLGAARDEGGRLGKTMAATAVRPCVSPASRGPYQLQPVPPSPESTPVINATGNTPLVAASAIWLMTQAASGACRN